MTPKEMYFQSKYLSMVLRHDPEKAGIVLDPAGWTGVTKLLVQMKISMSDLESIVAENNKKRFEFNDDKTLIRASQGHTVDVDLGYTEVQPPDQLFHGSYQKVLDVILKEGLKKMERHHVHLSEDRATAFIVASRRQDPIVLKVASLAMYQDGHKFYKSTNGVWLVESVPIVYLTQDFKIKIR